MVSIYFIFQAKSFLGNFLLTFGDFFLVTLVAPPLPFDLGIPTVGEVVIFCLIKRLSLLESCWFGVS